VAQQSLLEGQYSPDMVGSGLLAGNVRACHVTPPSLVMMTSDTTAVGLTEQPLPAGGDAPFAGHGEGLAALPSCHSVPLVHASAFRALTNAKGDDHE
jgi:hypothetical protein